jgi:hypothetical protein
VENARLYSATRARVDELAALLGERPQDQS